MGERLTTCTECGDLFPDGPVGTWPSDECPECRGDEAAALAGIEADDGDGDGRGQHDDE